MRSLNGKRVALGAAVGLAMASCSMLAGGTALANPAGSAAATPPKFEVGKSYAGRSEYIEYLPGNAPVILTAPHGGYLQPDSIPDRTKEACGGVRTVVGTDRNTQELVRAMRESFHARFGTYPHVIINRLARRKLDANRPSLDGACGNAEAEYALKEWHAFIDIAKAEILKTGGRGWYMDIHGHGHKIQRLELGYLLSSEQLDRSDAEIDASAGINGNASVRTLVDGQAKPLSALLRGPLSLGTLFAQTGFPAVPSAGDPSPKGERYFSGGHNTRRHTCGAEATPLGGATDGAICGVQIETHFRGVRDTPENRKRFGDAAAQALETFLATHWEIELKQGAKLADASK